MQPDNQSSSPNKAYWRANIILLSVLLGVWFFVSFILAIVLAKPLNTFHIAGFPLGFWIAQQGSIVVFVLLIFIYAAAMQFLEASKRAWRVVDAPDFSKSDDSARAQNITRYAAQPAVDPTITNVSPLPPPPTSAPS